MLPYLTYFISCSLFFLSITPASAQFGEKQVVASQQESQSYVLVADLNQDGVSDVVAVESESTNESTSLRYIIRYNDGNGNFDQGQLIKEENKEPWIDLRATDIDGDGKTDLVIRQDEADKLGWLRNQGDSFAWEADMLSNFTSYEVIDYTFGKVNDDQYLDLLFVTEEGVFWSKNNYEEPFGPPTLLLSPEDENVTSLFTNDFDEDGDDDIFLLGDFVSVFRRENTGSYTFQKLEAEYFIEMQNPRFADMDGDGKKDLVLSDGFPCDASNLWYFKNTDSSFGESPNYIAGYSYGIIDADYISNYYVEDVDGDGDNDIYTSSEYEYCSDGGAVEYIGWIENFDNWNDAEYHKLLNNNKIDFYTLDSDNRIDFQVNVFKDDDFVWIKNTGLSSKETLIHQYNVLNEDELHVQDIILIDWDKNNIVDIISADKKKVALHNQSNSPRILKHFGFAGNIKLFATDIGSTYSKIFVSHEGITGGWYSRYEYISDNNFFKEQSTNLSIGDPPYAAELFLTDYDSDSNVDVFVNSGNGFDIDLKDIFNYDDDGIDDFITKDGVYVGLPNGEIELVLNIGGNQVHDVDGDGLDDILYIAERNRGTSYWHQNQGDGQFSEQKPLSLAPQGAYHFSDVDKDGDADFLYDNGGRLVWKENTDGLGNFGDDQLIEAVATTVIRSADMDDDGDMDLVVGGDGFIYEYENLYEATTPLSLSVEDSDGLQLDTISVPIKIESGFENITSLSFSLTWEAGAATFAGISSTEGLTLNETQIEDGKLGISWENNGGQSKSDGSTFFSLLLVLTGNEQSTVSVSFANDPVTSAVTNTDGETVALNTKNAQVTIKESQPPTGLSLNDTSVGENQPVGSVVGKFTTTDPDNSEGFIYTLVEGEGDDDNALFTIKDDELLTNAEFDFEEEDEYNVRVKTTDSRGKSFEKPFSITIEDVDDTNEPPTDITLSASSLDENNDPGVVVGELSAVAEDDDTHTFTLVGGDGSEDNELFEISNDQLQALASFDFEEKPEYKIRIQADDGNGGIFSKPFTITINDLDESTNSVPTAIIIDKAAVEENQPAETLVGTLTTDDADENDTHTYALVAGEGDQGNERFQIQGDQLQTKTSLDYEEQTEYSIRVQTDDGNGGKLATTFTITVVNQSDDKNLPPTDITLSNNAIDENQPVGTVIGTLLSEDPDNAIFSYSLVDGNGDTHNELFSIKENELRSAASFDYETQSQLSIRIQSDDGRGGTFSKQFDIVINDIADQANRFPTDILLSNQTIREDQPAGAVVGVFTTEDPDAEDQHTYRLVSGSSANNNTSFTINGNELLSTEPFDYSTKNSYIVRVQTDDGKGGTLTKSFVISITQTGSVVVLGVVNPIEDQQATANEPFTLEIPNNVFEGESFTLTVSQADGSPLPDWLTFDATSNTLSGTPPEGDVSVEVRITATDAQGDTASDDFVLSVSGVTALGDEITDNLRIYPVPAQNHLVIESKQASLRLQAYRLMDTQGKVLIDQPKGQNLLGNVRIDISSLAEGVYFLEIQTNRGRQQQRVLLR
jgi:hypothetical protein